MDSNLGRRFTVLRIIGSCLAVLLSVPEAPAQTSNTTVDVSDQFVGAVGDAWNAYSNSTIDESCIVFQEDRRPGGSGGSATGTLSYVLTSHQMLNAMKFGTRGKVKGLLSTVGFSAGAKYEYFKSNKLNNEEEALILRYESDGPTVRVASKEGKDRVLLKDWAKDLAETNLPEFIKHCGQGYISVIWTHAETIGSFKRRSSVAMLAEKQGSKVARARQSSSRSTATGSKRSKMS